MKLTFQALALPPSVICFFFTNFNLIPCLAIEIVIEAEHRLKQFRDSDQWKLSYLV